MTNVLISSGMMVNTSQSIAQGDVVLIAQGGALMVPTGSGVVAPGNNAIYVSGEITGGRVSGNPITVSGSSGNVAVDISITPTGRLQTYGGDGNAIATEIVSAPVHVTNAGYIGGSVALSANGDIFRSVAGIVAGNVSLGFGNDGFYFTGGNVQGTISGNEGNDFFIVSLTQPGDGILRISGDDGSDYVDFRSVGVGLWIDLDYAGYKVWTRDSIDLNTGAWRAVADIRTVETIFGSAANDYISGDNGNNIFFYAGGIDTISGDGGIDTVDFSNLPAVWIDLAYNGYEAFTQDDNRIDDTGTWRPVADLTSIETINTTTGDDKVWGDGNANTILFLGTTGPNRTDFFDGRGGTDTVDFSGYFYGVWANLGYVGDVEVWTKQTADVNMVGGTFVRIADLANIENLSGSIFGDDLAGDGSANRLEGNAGSDRLFGGGGSDTFVFSPLLGLVGADTIVDFLPGTDKIGLKGLSALPTVVINGLPGTSDDTLIYNSSNGQLSFDGDGNAPGGSVLLATLTGNPAVTAADFILV